jgi:hypothetical protein
LKSSVAYADPGYDAFLKHGSGIGKNPDPESGYRMNTPDNFSESLETVFRFKKT